MNDMRISFIKRVQSYAADHETFELLLRHHESVASTALCQSIVDFLDQMDPRHWHLKRHSAHPTTDLPVSDLFTIHSDLFKEIQALIKCQVMPLLQEMSGLQNLEILDLFIVKYECSQDQLENANSKVETTARDALGWHTDGSLLSFNILLNDPMEFTGGGTFFRLNSTSEIVHKLIQQGDILIHPSKYMHAGAKIHSGKRLILAGFVDTADVVAVKRQLIQMSQEKNHL